MEHVRAMGSAAVAAVGLEHVWLSYYYLDTGDLDGYRSLFHPDAVVRRPDRPAVHGADADGFVDGARFGKGRHILHSVFASDNQVAAVGRFVGDGPDLEFADIVTVSPCGLLTAVDTYHLTAV